MKNTEAYDAMGDTSVKSQFQKKMYGHGRIIFV